MARCGRQRLGRSVSHARCGAAEIEIQSARLLRCLRRRIEGRTEGRGTRRHDRLRHRARTERLARTVVRRRHIGRRAARAVHRVVGVDQRAHLLRLGPVVALPAGQGIELRGELLETLGIAPLGIDLEQLGADRRALGRAAHRFLEDLLGLKIAPVGQVHIGLGHRIDVADRIELAERIAHRRRRAAGIAGIDALATARAEERIGLQPTFEERGLATVASSALREAIDSQSAQQRHDGSAGRKQQRVLFHPRHDAGGRRYYGGHRRCAYGRSSGHGGCRCGTHRRRGWRSCGRRGCGRRRASRCGSRHCGCRGRYGCRCGCRRRWRGGWWRHRRRGNEGRCDGRRCRGCRASHRRTASVRGRGDARQRLDVAVEFGQSAVGSRLFTILRDAVFGTARRGDAATAERELVGRRGRAGAPVVDLGFDLAAGLTRSAVGAHRRNDASQALAVSAEVRALGLDDLARLGRRRGIRGFGIRHRQHRAGAQPVHVVVDEGGRIAAKQGDQHLVERYPGTLRARCDARQAVARADAVFVDTRGGWARRSRGRSARLCRRTGCGCGATLDDTRCRCGRCLHGCRGHRGRGDARGHGRCGRHGFGRARHRRRVEEHRVFAHQPARRPGEFEDHVDEGLLHRAIAGQAQKRAAVAAALHHGLGSRQHGVVVDAGGAECIRRRDAHPQAGRLFGGHAGDVDLRAKRFTERRLHRQASQPECERIARAQTGGNGDRGACESTSKR